MRVRRWLARTGKWGLLVVAALSASAAYHLQLPLLRNAARVAVNGFVSSQIQGRLHIGKIDELSFGRIVTRDIALFDASGGQVIRADRIELVPDLQAALSGTLRFSSVRLYRGHLRLQNGPSGLPTFIEAFESARPSRLPGGPGLKAVVDDIVIETLTAEGEVLDLSGLRAEWLRLHGRMEVYDGVKIQFFGGQGELVRPYDVVGRVAHLSGRIDTGEAEIVRLFAKGSVRRRDGPADSVQLNLRYGQLQPDDPEPQLDLHVRGAPADLSLLADLRFEWGAVLQGSFDGYFALTGPPTDLALRVWGDTSGGPISIEGAIRADDEVRVRGRSDALDLGAIVRGAPTVTLRGEASLIAPANPPDAFPEVSAQVEAFAWGGLAIPPFSARGKLLDDRVRIEQFEAPYGRGALEGSGDVTFDGALDATVRARVPQLQRDANLRSLVPGLSGSLDAEVHLTSGPSFGQPLEIAGTATLRRFGYGALTAERLNLEGAFALAAAGPALELTLDGSAVDVGGYALGQADVRIKPERQGLHRVDADFKRGGKRSLQVRAEAAVDDAQITVQAPHIEYHLGDQLWGGAIENLVYSAQGVRVERVLLASGSQRLEASGVWREQGPEELQAQLQDFDVAGLRSLLAPTLPPLTGRTDATVMLQGDLSDPAVTIQGALREGTLAPLEDLLAVYMVEYKEGGVSVDAQLDLGGRGTFTLAGGGVVDRSQPDLVAGLQGGMYELNFEVAQFDLSAAHDFVDRRVPRASGSVDGSMTLSGPLFAPTIQGDLDIPRLGLPDWPDLGVSTHFSYENGVLVTRLVTRDDEGEWLETETSLVIDLAHLVEKPEEAIASLESLPWRVSARASPRPLAEWPAPVRAYFHPDLGPLSVSLSATFAGGAFETRADVYLMADWEGSLSAFCAQRAQPRLSVNASLRDGVTTAVLRGFVGARRVVELEATAPTPLDRWIAEATMPALPPTRVSAFADNVPLEALPVVCQYAGGPLTAGIELEGLFTHRPKANVELRSSALEVMGSPPLRADFVGDVTEDHVILDGNTRWWGPQAAAVRVEIPVEWNPWPRLAPRDLKLALQFSDAPAGPFLSWIPQIRESDGLLSGRFEATGPLDRLRSSGRLRLSDGYLEIVGLGQHLTQVNGNLDFRGTWVRLEGITARDGDGELRIDGSVRLKGHLPAGARFSVNSRAFPIRQEGTPLASLTGNALVEADIQPDATTLGIEVRRLTIRLPDDGGRSVQDLDPHPDIVFAGQEKEEADKPEEVYPIGIALRAVQPFWVRRADFAVQLAASLDVLYRDPNLFIGGNIEMRRGFFEVFGRRFQVERGTMNFDGGPELDPEVNLVAVHELRTPADTNVTVVVTGELTEPEIAFQTNHPDCTERSEIISMLVSGRCTVVAQGEDDGERQAASFLAGVLAGVATIWARGELGEVLPVLVIESSDSGQGARLRAGFQADSIIPDFLRSIVTGAYIEGVITASGADEDQRENTTLPGASIELQFPANLVGSGDFNPPDNFSVDLTWEP